MGHLITDTLTHEIWVYAERGDPGACLDAETEVEEVADHESDDTALYLGDDADVFFALNVFFDQRVEINIHRFANDGRANANDIPCIFYFKLSGQNRFHAATQSLCR